MQKRRSGAAAFSANLYGIIIDSKMTNSRPGAIRRAISLLNNENHQHHQENKPHLQHAFIHIQADIAPHRHLDEQRQYVRAVQNRNGSKFNITRFRLPMLIRVKNDVSLPASPVPQYRSDPRASSRVHAVPQSRGSSSTTRVPKLRILFCGLLRTPRAATGSPSGWNAFSFTESQDR